MSAAITATKRTEGQFEPADAQALIRRCPRGTKFYLACSQTALPPEGGQGLPRRVFDFVRVSRETALDFIDNTYGGLPDGHTLSVKAPSHEGGICFIGVGAL